MGGPMCRGPCAEGLTVLMGNGGLHARPAPPSFLRVASSSQPSQGVLRGQPDEKVPS